MTSLILEPNLENPYDAYAALLAAHDGLSERDSLILNVRLVLILMNHVGEHSIWMDAINFAKDGMP